MRTLGFAVKTKTIVRSNKRSQRIQKVGNVTEALLKVFGLEVTKDTFVGNEFVQGVSGGERKRVSLSEVVSNKLNTRTIAQAYFCIQMSTNAKVSLWDNSTQGLDSTTAVRFGKALQRYARAGHNIAVAALYQASDDLVNLFDKVTLLHQGRQIFFGTISEAQDYLESLGFVWSDRQSLSEFLISVTDLDVRITKEGWEERVPRAIEDWERRWKGSVYYRKLQKDIESQANGDHTELATPSSISHASPKHRPRKNPYVLTWRAQL